MELYFCNKGFCPFVFYNVNFRPERFQITAFLTDQKYMQIKSIEHK